MKKPALYLPLMALVLASCSKPAPAPLTDAQVGLINYPRATRATQPICSIEKSAALAFKNAKIYAPIQKPFGFSEPRPATTTLKAQSIPGFTDDVLGSMNYTRAFINSYYYGFSTDLNTVHNTWAKKARTNCKDKLKGCTINAAHDALMSSYFEDFKDGHTYYIEPGGSAQTKSFGFDFRLPRSSDRKTVVDGMVVTSVTKGSPAFLAGLRRGDLITEINGQTLVVLNQSDLTSTYFDYYDKYIAASNVGAAVTFKYKRAGVLASQSIQAASLQDSLPWGEIVESGANKYYYLYIPSFDIPGMYQVVNDLVANAKAANITKMVVDVRSNPGGYIYETIASVAAFTPSSASITHQDILAQDVRFYVSGASVNGSWRCSSDIETIATIKNPQVFGGDMVILVDEYSGSGGEVFPQLVRTGNSKVKVVGVNTYGIMNTSTQGFDFPGDRTAYVTLGRAVQANGAYYPDKVAPNIQAQNDMYQLSQGNDLGINAALKVLFP